MTYLSLFSCILFSTTLWAAKGASYSAVWSEVQKKPYQSLPQYSVTKASFFKAQGFFKAKKNLLKADVDRTLSVGTAILPRFQKLVHPIGICFSGTWSITEKSDYTGYFEKGSEALIIVRASEAMGQPLASGIRSLGLAGMLFPTTDPEDATLHETASFFAIDDLGGQQSASFLDLPKSNAPPISKHFSTLFNLPTLLTIASVFKDADRHPEVRQVYPIAELGMEEPEQAVTPYKMELRSENRERPGKDDFRDELRLKNFPDGLIYSIWVGDEGAPLARIGQIELTHEALTDSCDHRLHFGHPVWK